MACVGEEELSEIQQVLMKTVNFGLGVHVAEFEKKIGEFLKTDREVIAVNTGTSALHLALEVLNFPKGSEVLVPSLTFVASYSAISAAGLTPVSCEVEWPNAHIDCQEIEKRITSKTVAIMPVAYTGTDFNRTHLYSLAQKHGLRVIEDDAHAFGCINSEKLMFGASGDIVCFSFDGIKNITCGEGGAIVLKDKELAHKIRVARSLGIEKDVELRYKGQRAWEYDIKSQGFRYHMSNINAAMGIAQLRKIEKFRTKKAKLLHLYREALSATKLSDVLLETQTPQESDILHIYSCILPKGVSRSDVREKMLEMGIETGFHYAPNHLHSMYLSKYSLPVAEELGVRLISLPFHCNMSEEDPLKVIQALSKVLDRSRSS
jgi:dTDP-4-amino-4,6-dideoxygalactose transaminase